MHPSVPHPIDGLKQFVRDEAPDLPEPGSGETWRRFEGLASWAGKDLSLGRLVEGHADALAILSEAGASPSGSPGATYGVWAARSGGEGTRASAVPRGWRLSGDKPFCSGGDQLDRALVTAEGPEGYCLFDVSVAEQVVAVQPDSWPAVGMADSQSMTLTFGGPVLPESSRIGGPGFYLDRPGFWFGSVGVAACWYGGAHAAVESLLGSLSPTSGEHVLADVGRAVARLRAMGSVLKVAAEEIDRDPSDADGHGQRRALAVRQVVHDGCLEVLSLVASAGGAGPLCHDPGQSRRVADLFIYLAQHHGGADAAVLGRIAMEAR